MQKYSRQRVAITENLKNRSDHPCADELYEALRVEYPNISMGTVYRNLGRLSEMGEIINFNVDGREHFDGNIKPHPHFICLKCSIILDLPENTHDNFVNRAEELLGCTVTDIKLILRGFCKECCSTRDE